MNPLLRNLLRRSACVLLLMPCALAVAKPDGEAPGSNPSAAVRLAEALNQSTTLEFDHVPLATAAETLAKRWQINVVIDRKALEEAGIPPETPLTAKITDLPLKTALSQALLPAGLDWIAADGVLTFTIPDVVAAHLDTKVYDVSELVAAAGDEIDRTEFYDTLLELVVSTVAPDTWIDSEGAGDIRSFEAGGIETLVVYQHRHVHEQIETLLKDLTKARHEKPAKVKSSAKET